MSDSPTLQFTFKRNGKPGRGILSVLIGADAIYTDEVNLASEKNRKHCVDRICNGRSGIPRDAVGQELLKLIGDCIHVASDAGDGSDATRLDISKIIRAELFITPDVIGIAVPEPIVRHGKPDGRWALNLSWADGKRESRELSSSIVIPTGSRLWINPVPAPPSPSLIAGWSVKARARWLAGEKEPGLADVFARICRAISDLVDFPENESAGIVATLALWVLLTYAFPAWPAIPYVYIGGPLGSGKTRFFEVLQRLVFRPLVSSNVTAAALFRTLNDRGGTLLMDEAERLKETTPDAGELRSILLAGYKRGSKATRLEASGDTFKTVEFDCYGPKAIACIGGLPPALASRCITVVMFRAAPGSEKPKRRVDADPQMWTDLRDDLHALAIGSLGRAANGLSIRSDICALSGREFELWQPLMALASMIESVGTRGLLNLIRSHAARVTEAAQDDQTPDVDETLLKALAEMVLDGSRLAAPTPGEILSEVQRLDPEAFKRWNARTVSNHLKRYGLVTIRSGAGRFYRDVTAAELAKVQRNYQLDLGVKDVPGVGSPAASLASPASLNPTPDVPNAIGPVSQANPTPAVQVSQVTQVTQVTQEKGGVDQYEIPLAETDEDERIERLAMSEAGM